MAKLPTEIKRYPFRKNDPLQGWDSSDELLLAYLAGEDLVDKKILIINDHFGALSCPLKKFNPTIFTDSYVSYQAILHNSAQELRPIHQLSSLSGLYDYVIIQLPKNMSFLEDILCHLTNHMHADSKVICGAMVKHMAPSSFDLLNKYIGETSTGLAVKKARLIFATFTKGPVSSPYPISVKIDSFDKMFTHHSNLFSREKLDVGTRFFLEHIPQGTYTRILDLGCANGVIGIKAKQLNPEAQVTFSDESSMAIESARINYQAYFDDEAQFLWMNCFEGQANQSLDLILCNPPFHQQHTIGDFIAWQMFTDSLAALKPGGILRVIGNSHLGYQVKLKKIFGNSKIISSNQKFVICEARK